MRRLLKSSLLLFAMITVLIFSVVVSFAAYRGDADNDGKVTAMDARTILRASVGLEKISEKMFDYADVDGDGKLSAMDARTALRMSVGLDKLQEFDHKHDYIVTVSTAPTCTKKGVQTLKCSICSATVTRDVAPVGHKLGEWNVYKAPTVTKDGSERRVCSSCNYYEERVLKKENAVYYITVNNGYSDSYKIPVGKDGKYSVPAPVRIGYAFKGWKTSDGKSFSAGGTIKANTTINAVWEILKTDTLAKLAERTNGGADKILISADITVNKPIYISYDTEIYTEGNYVIKRHPDYTGDIFVVGCDETGRSSVLLHRKAVLTLKAAKGGSLTIDGNKASVKKTVKGSLIYLNNSGVVNIYDGINLINNKKLGNERVAECSGFVSNDAIIRVGGAAIAVMNGTVNMYGGSIRDNAVVTEIRNVTTAGGSYVDETDGCGGAVYNRGSFNMFGGEIRNNEALRGGAIYNDELVIISAGTVYGNKAATYGGAICSSGSSDSQIFIGTEKGTTKAIIAGNSSVKAGGAIYSNTNSPIVIYGNTTFKNNSSQSIGGAVYTGGGLTVRNTQFIGNSCTSLGGAIYHNYSNTSFTRRDLEVTNCSFDANTAYYGGAIGLGAADNATKEGTNALITGSTFKNNVADAGAGSGSGGAIYATKLTDLTVDGCQFTGNSAASIAGAVYVHGGTVANIRNSAFSKNSAVYGGTINYQSGSLTMSGCTIDGGSASYGGAIYANALTLKLSDMKFTGNTSTSYGGALYLNGTTLSLTGKSEFTSNSSKSGGAVFIKGGSFNATNGSFTKNTATGNGGAVDAEPGTVLSFTGTTFTENSAADSTSGGAVYAALSEVSLKNVTMKGNKAGYGGAAAICAGKLTVTGTSTVEGNTGKVRAGAFEINKYGEDAAEASISGAVFKSNTAPYAGAVFMANCSVNITEGSFISNAATADIGGAIYTTSGSHIINAVFTKNTAVNCGGAIGIGGAAADVTLKNSTATGNSAANGGMAYVKAGKLTIAGGAYDKNTATGNGGAINAVAGTKVTVTDAAFTGNTVSDTTSGGAIYASVAEASLKNVTMKGNRAGYGGAAAVCGGKLTVTGASKLNENIGKVRAGAFELNAYGEEKANASITGASFNGNTAPYAGAMFMANCSASVSGGRFEKNTATAGNGGAVYATSGTHTISAVFSGNKASADGGAIGLTGADVTLTDVTATGNSAARGGALFADTSAAKLTLNNCIVTDNSASNGGAAYINGGSLKATGGKYNNNTAVSNGGAVYTAPSASAEIVNAELSGNTAGDSTSGGAICSYNADVALSNVTMTGNTAGYGGAAAVLGGKLTITGENTVKNNTGKVRAGAFDLGKNTTEAKVTIDGTVFEANTAPYAGAVYMANCSAEITDSFFRKNIASTGNGGAVTVKSGTHSIKAELTENKAVNGGAVSVEGGIVTLADVNASANNATKGGVLYIGAGTVNVTGGSFSGNTAANGGVAYANAGALNVTGGTYSGNTVTGNGGAIYAAPSSAVRVDGAALTSNRAADNTSGGALIGYDADVTLRNVTMTGNTAGYGGAAAILGGKLTMEGENTVEGNIGKVRAGAFDIGKNTTEAEVAIDGTVFDENTAPYAGAIYMKNSSVAITDSIFNKNTATNGNGGAIYTTQGTHSINAVFTDNTASADGGAVGITAATVSFTDVTATGNKASKGGFVFADSADADVELNGCTVTGNTAANGGAAYAKSGALDITGGTYSENNVTGNGGAVYAAPASTVIIDGAAFTENKAADNTSGGAIIGYNAAVTLKNSTFSGNTAGYGGAISLNASTLTASGANAFNGNTATVRGGAIDAAALDGIVSTVAMTDGVFTGNTAPAGGAVYARTGCKVSFSTTAFTANKSTDVNGSNSKDIGGGAIYGFTNTEISLSGVTLDGNESLNYGGALMANGAASVTVGGGSAVKNSKGNTGSALYFLSVKDVKVSDTEISSNTSAWNGAVYLSVTAAEFKNITATSNISNKGGVFYVSAGDIDLINVTATGNKAVRNGSTAGFGGAVYAGGGTVDIIGGVYTGNTSADHGGAVYIAGGTVNATGAEFTENVSGDRGGAVYAEAGTHNLNAVFKKNTAYHGGAVAVYGAQVTLTGAAATENKANGGNGGAAYVKTGSLTVNGGTFTGNTASESGGAFNAAVGTVLNVSSAVLNGNSTGEGKSGGAIAAFEAAVTVNNVTLTGNTSGYGGAAAINGGSFTATGANTISNNTATERGGAVEIANYTNNAVVSIAGTDFIENEAPYAGAVFMKNSSVTITASEFDGNNATNDVGGAIFTTSGTHNISADFRNNTAKNSGGAIGVRGATVTVDKSSFEANKTTYKHGAAVYIESGAVTVTESSFAENKANDRGGAVYAEAGSHSLNAVFTKNTAYNGGAIAVYGADVTLTGAEATENNANGGNGGAAYVKTGSLTVNGGSFTANTASGNGGAIGAESGTAVYSDGAEFIGNSTSASGGAIYAAKASVEIKNSSFNENTAGYGGAISLNASTLTASGANAFNGNTATVRGGAIDAAPADSVVSTVTMSGGTFTGNCAPAGGAVYVRTGCKVSFSTTAFTANKSTDVNGSNSKDIGGGAIYGFTNTEISLSGVTLDGNESLNYGGALMANGAASVTVGGGSAVKNSKGNTGSALYFLGVKDVKVSDTEISSNTAAWNGAVYLSVTAAEFKNITATSNSSNKGGVFYVSAGDIDLINVTATGNMAVRNGSTAGYGGAVYAGGGTVDIIGGVYTGNTSADHGGAVYIAGGTVNTTGAEFTENVSGDRGGAVYAVAGTHNLNAVFTKNTAYHGGAVAVDNANAKIILTNATATENKANVGNGGVVYIKTGSVEINGGSFTKNTGSSGGAVYASPATKVAVTGASFTENSTAKDESGGVICSFDADVSLSNVTIEGNTAGYGGAAAINGGKLTMTGENTVKNNIGTVRAGAFELNKNSTAAVVSITGTSFEGNTAPLAGAVYAGIGNVDITGCTFKANSATAGNGGAVATGTNSALVLNVTDCTFEGNTAPIAGAVYAGIGNVDITGCTFKANSATAGNGGAVATGTNSALVLNVTDCTFEANSAAGNGGAVEIQTGNTYSNGDPTGMNIVFKNTVLKNNFSNSVGGAVDIRSGSYVKFDGVDATGNYSVLKHNGAVFYATSANTRLYLTGKITASGNTAGKDDEFAYSSGSPAYIYTDNSSDEAWIAMSFFSKPLTYVTTMP